jgi:lantibiotic biosynthesis protein
MNKPQNHRDFVPSGFFAFRTPLLPFNELLAWSEGLKAPAALDDPAELEKAVSEDRKLLQSRLQNALMRPEIREAIFVASPDLDDGFDRWLRDPESEKGLRVERALARYYQRMASRSTPFGLFAGCSVGAIGEEFQLTVEARKKYLRHTRLDMDYLYALIDVLDRDAELRKAVLYYPNTSLYRAAERIRYVETRLSGEVRSHFLVAVEETNYLNTVLERAQRGAAKVSLASTIL